jgi:cell division protein FtsW
MLQPDFGTAVIVAVLMLGMLYLAGGRILHLSALTVPILAGAVVLVLMKPYRLKRWLTFLDPWKDASNSGFQIIQSWISFGSGGPFGVGLGDGMQKLFYLPEPHTDFILSVVAEEVGFIGVAVVIALFIFLVFQGFVVAYRAADLFGTLLAAGLTTLIALEASINIAAVVGLIPTKGLALPFMSYGGSSLVMSLAAVGIILSIAGRR